MVLTVHSPWMTQTGWTQQISKHLTWWIHSRSKRFMSQSMRMWGYMDSLRQDLAWKLMCGLSNLFFSGVLFFFKFLVLSKTFMLIPLSKQMEDTHHHINESEVYAICSPTCGTFLVKIKRSFQVLCMHWFYALLTSSIMAGTSTIGSVEKHKSSMQNKYDILPLKIYAYRCN
jgi:hypothetical protein